METTRAPQEKLSAILSTFVFFIPMLMNVKTPFVVKYMKQWFIINVVELVLAIISSVLWWLIGITGLLNFICVLTSCWLAYKAYTGEEFSIPVLLENSDKLIQGLGVGKWFASK
jgi:uncharacterized membrane protein